MSRPRIASLVAAASLLTPLFVAGCQSTLPGGSTTPTAEPAQGWHAESNAGYPAPASTDGAAMGRGRYAPAPPRAAAEAPMKRAPATGWPVPQGGGGARPESAPPSDDGEGWRVEAEKAAREESIASEREAGRAAAARKDRPGLGTEWGETRYSPIQEVAFERATDLPFSVATLFYNDRTGVDAMASYEARRGARLRAPVAVRPGVTVSIVGEDGSPLDALALDGRVYVVGEAGRRYSVVLSNSTPHRVEVVVSVDGLDAVDGKAANFGKRGYLLAPWDSLTIDGFRRSEREVAAFRFGSVRGSYAARSGSDRNVGVVGVALFAERGSDWDDDELERRRTAEPFSDSRFAAPPSDWE